MRLILFLALCVSASAATVPTMPAVHRAIKRPQPLLSPKHASIQKATPMARFSPAGGGVELPKKLPMKSYCVEVQPGVMNFTAEALQPPNKSVLFELSSTITEGSWVTLAWFGPYPVAQQVFAMVPTEVPFASIRATAGTEPSGTMSRVVVAATPGIRINPDVKGVQAWRGAR
jgi:hypothetical protein